MNMKVRSRAARSLCHFGMQRMQRSHPRRSSANSNNVMKDSLEPLLSTGGTVMNRVLSSKTVFHWLCVVSVRNMLKSILTGFTSLSSQILVMTSSRYWLAAWKSSRGEMRVVGVEGVGDGPSSSGVEEMEETSQGRMGGGAEGTAGTSGPPQRPGTQAHLETLGGPGGSGGSLASYS